MTRVGGTGGNPPRGNHEQSDLVTTSPARGVEMQSLLSDVKVLEVGNFMAVPFAGMILSDLGAEVTKVENPERGDETRSTPPFVGGEGAVFLQMNRNKRSIALDLKHPRGADAFRRLACDADVVLENLRPGAMVRLGLGYDALAALNAGLVYVAASGWGRDGPAASRPGLDIMAQARSGLMSITGEPGGPPAKVGVPICDLTCALYVAIAALSALHERVHTGRGQFADVSLFEAGVSFTVWEAARFFSTGEIGARRGSAHQATAPYQAIVTADGWITVGAVTPKTWSAFCDVLEATELIQDERFRDAGLRFKHVETLIPLIEAITVTRPSSHWLAGLEAAGVPCAPIQHVGQVYDDPTLTARAFLWQSEHPLGGSICQLGSPLRFSKSKTIRRSAAPLLGEHTREVLGAAGFDTQEVDRLLTDGAARAAEGNEASIASAQ